VWLDGLRPERRMGNAGVILTRIVQGILVAAVIGLVTWIAHEVTDLVTGSDGDRRRQDPAPETATEDDEDDRAA
jgi:hypothetical protein